MKMSSAIRLLALLVASGCAPEVIDLAMFDLDAGGAGTPLDTGTPSEGELDAEHPTVATDAALDTGRVQIEFDARMRGDADRSDADRGNIVCTSKDDCSAGHVCDLVGCGANVKGTCVLADDCSDDKFEPVCDCNGFKHLNDCERRRHGAAKDRECAAQRPPCTGKGTCPSTPDGLPTHCGWLAQRPSMTWQCTRGERACFILPECPGLFGPIGRSPFSACDPNASGASITMGALEICTSACDAIKAGEQYAPASFQRCLTAPPKTGGSGSGFSTF